MSFYGYSRYFHKLEFLRHKALILRTRNVETAAASSPRPKVEVFIDGDKILVDPGMTILQACALKGVDIPRFCYHDKLSIAGNCRMCLVEVEKSVKPVASCAMPVANGMKVWTNSPMTKKARESVMEFLLVNHPLDCPICDQGGECDLQDQSMAFGSDRSRLQIEHDGKRAVEDKNIGPLIKTIMTRCIHCTRCIRFANEIAGVPDLGSTGRGGDMQIGTYVEKLFASELSGNVIDLCPVGALTSKQYSFVARPWETRKTESIDVMDAMGSNIVISHRTGEIMRIIPRLNEDINEEWIGDKSRFICDGLKRQRILQPMVRSNLFEGELVPSNWEEALFLAALKIRQTPPNAILGLVGALVDTEALVAFKDLLNMFNCENTYTEGDFPTSGGGIDIRSNYLFNDRIASIEQCDALLLVGTNPRYEAPVLNARIRKIFMYTDIEIGLIGSPVDLTYDYQYLGSSQSAVDDVLAQRSHFSKILHNAKHPMVIVGFDSLHKSGGDVVFSSVRRLASKLRSRLDGNAPNKPAVFNILHRNAAQTAAFDLGYRPFNSPSLDGTDAETLRKHTRLLFLLGADDGQISRENFHPDVFIIYQGHHGDSGAEIADLVLPGATYTEKEATWINTEGRSQRGFAAVTPPGDAREDWKILRALSEVAGRRLLYDSLAELRQRIFEIAPHILRYGDAEPAGFSEISNSLLDRKSQKINTSTNPRNTSLEVNQTLLEHFWLTNSIARASPTMVDCVKASRNYMAHPHLDPILLQPAAAATH